MPSLKYFHWSVLKNKNSVSLQFLTYYISFSAIIFVVKIHLAKLYFCDILYFTSSGILAISSFWVQFSLQIDFSQ